LQHLNTSGNEGLEEVRRDFESHFVKGGVQVDGARSCLPNVADMKVP
jgi:hypothetical protein